MDNATNVCSNCGSTVTGVTEDLPICPYCGTRLTATQGMNSNWANSAKINNNTFAANQNTHMNTNKSQSDEMAIAGFVL